MKKQPHTEPKNPGAVIGHLTALCSVILLCSAGCGQQPSEPNPAPPRAKVADPVRDRMMAFSNNKGLQISYTIEKIKAAEVLLQYNIRDYTNTLEGLGRGLDDPTLHSWHQLLGSMGKDRQELEVKLKQAFLWSEKFRLAPSAAMKTELATRLSAGNAMAAEITARYREYIRIKTNS